MSNTFGQKYNLVSNGKVWGSFDSLNDCQYNIGMINEVRNLKLKKTSDREINQYITQLENAIKKALKGKIPEGNCQCKPVNSDPQPNPNPQNKGINNIESFGRTNVKPTKGDDMGLENYGTNSVTVGNKTVDGFNSYNSKKYKTDSSEAVGKNLNDALEKAQKDRIANTKAAIKAQKDKNQKMENALDEVKEIMTKEDKEKLEALKNPEPPKQQNNATQTSSSKPQNTAKPSLDDQEKKANKELEEDKKKGEKLTILCNKYGVFNNTNQPNTNKNEPEY